MSSCNHKSGPFKCDELGMQDVRGMHQNFYATPDRQVQNEFILKFITVRNPIRRRSKLNLQRTKVSIRCFHNKQCNGIVTRIHVCKQNFVNTLCISKDRVQSLCNTFSEEGTTPVDKRGGDTRSNALTNKQEAIRAFTNSIQPVEKHYSRAKNVHVKR